MPRLSLPANAQRTSAASRPSAPAGTGEAIGPRTPTLTQKMRQLQPPDVARQAMSELGVLARELATLPELLEASGLARTHQHPYFEATQAYVGLARQAWEAVAEERLEQSGAEPEYRQRAISVARRITQLQQEARTASGNTEFKLPRKTPYLWRRRTALVSNGLRVWQDRLAPTPNPTEMGRGLFLLRSYLGLAVAGPFSLGLLDFLIGATVTLLTLFGVGLIALLVAAIIAGSASNITTFAVGTVATALLWIFVRLLMVNGPLPLGLLLGASVFSPSRTTRNAHNGSLLTSGILRIWGLLIGMLTIPALLGALALGADIVRMQTSFVAPESVQQGFLLAGMILALGAAPATIVCLALVLLVALPVLFVTLIRSAIEVASSPSWVPAARHYALEPALVVQTIITCALVIAVWGVTTAFNLQSVTLVTLPFGAPNVTISLRSVALLLALVLPYTLLLDLPYRSGIRRWQRSWLGDLTVRRADVESHIRRLSVTDPRSGAQDTSDENLRAMQYDLVLLQFYQSKIEEAERVPYAPVRRRSMFFAFIIVVSAALLLDAGASSLLHLVPLVGG